MSRTRVLLMSFIMVAANSSMPHSARVAPDQAIEPFAIELEPVLSGLSSPVFVTNAHDGSNRLFIVEQAGRIKVLQPGASTPTVFLDIGSKIVFGGERGLLGLAFHPQFPTNRRFFVNYTRFQDGATVIAEYHASASDPNVAEGSESVLLVIPQPFENHNGGMIEFGPDKFLYIGMGDGGSSNDPASRAQSIFDLLGKILRIDVDHANGSVPYSSPADNPFFGATAGLDEIFATGFRNPWRFSFDRKTGELYAADVGQGAWEEIDIVTRGGNYGWRVTEGNHCNPVFSSGSCGLTGFIPPIAEYAHTNGRCSITGGYVYRGSQSSVPPNTYVYADYCTGEIFTLTGGATSLLLDTSMNISSFGEDEAGEIYVVGLGGAINRIMNPNAPPPPPPPPPPGFNIRSATVQRRSNNEPLQPITVHSNGKKFDVIVVGTGYVEDSNIFVNGRKLKTIFHSSPPEAAFLSGRLKKDMLSQPGLLIVEVVNPDGAHSNQLMLTVVAE